MPRRANRTAGAGVPLPVLDRRTIRPSKSGRRRAIVLLAVHGLFAVHLAHWLSTGSSLTPLEPSEAMEFSKNGIVNAGLIFFALAILSTLVLGRWFCGWACHLVALQDGSRWLLGKLGLKPKPVNLGLLGLVPLLAFLYMFIAPPVYRLMHGHPVGVRGIHLTTETFWATFPTWIPAVLTFLCCGFVAIYLLGAKGFCTYGCPYGAAFGVVDQLAPVRIRVSDACDGNGHCTAVCSSNVRVAEEVRDYGMVVDPGCMKCLDCVSVCPTSALSVGWGRPALFAKRRTPAPAGERGRARFATFAGRLALAGVFSFVTLALLLWFDSDVDWGLTAVLTAMAVLVAAVFAGRSRPRRSGGVIEQTVLAGLFVASLFVFRGLYGMVPLLFALGLSAVVAWLVLLGLRLAYRREQSLHRWVLKKAGRLRPAGLGYAAGLTGLLVFAGHGAVVQYHVRMGQHHLRRIATTPAGTEAAAAAIDRAVHHAVRALDLGLLAPGEADGYVQLGRLAAQIDRRDDARRAFDEALRRAPDDAIVRYYAGAFETMEKNVDAAIAHFRRAVEIDPDFAEAKKNLAELEALASAPDTVEAEVAANILDQPVGDHTLRDFALPDDFVRRIADRIVRATYRERYRQVAPPEPAVAPPPVPEVTVAPGRLSVQRPALDQETLAKRAGPLEGRPALRGFTAPILGGPAPPAAVPGFDEADLAAAASHVGRHLARDGLLRTTFDVVERLGPGTLEAAGDDGLAALRAAGLPVDLLASFPPQGARLAGAWAVVADLCAHARAGRPRDELAARPFRFRAHAAGFRAATESGEHDVKLLRLQLTRGTYWRGPGAGGCLDVARQLLAAWPDAPAVASVQTDHLEALAPLAATWAAGRTAPLTLVAEQTAVAQWAQDSGKAGTIETRDGPVPATLAPRYASRHDDGSVFVPGESYLMDSLASTGHAVVHSTLLFQGGNLLCVADPASGERILLVGEAEVHRNTALGLAPAQVTAAFAAEFDVDRCVVLPAVSFHLDYDLTVRAHEGRLVVFVNDADAAARIIIARGIDALAHHGTLDGATARAAHELLRSGRDRELLDLVQPRVYAWLDAARRFPLALARQFAIGPTDSPTGNFQRFLAALDILFAGLVDPDRMTIDPHSQAFLRSLRRRRADEAELRGILESQGWTVVPVPGLADAEVSAVTVNGIHDRQRYLMPALGGLLGPLDEAAAEAFRLHLRGVSVVPVLSAESQRRVGAVHCSAAVYP